MPGAEGQQRKNLVHRRLHGRAGLSLASHIPEEFDSIPEDMGEQTRISFENIKKTVEAAGGTMDDIVDVSRFIVRMDEQDMANAAQKEFFPQPLSVFDHSGRHLLGDRSEMQDRGARHRGA